MISSTQNKQVKHIVQLQKKSSYRKAAKEFVVEGIKMYEELEPSAITASFVSEKFISSMGKTAGFELKNYEIVRDDVFEYMSETKTPQGILAVVRMREYELSEILAEAKGAAYLILDNLQDPGNLGTIIRAAEGAGISAIIMSKNTVDIYNPKVVRSSMGSIFRLSFVYAESLADTVKRLKQAKISVYASHVVDGKVYDSLDFTEATAFIIGNESAGVSDELLSLADARIYIPMLGRVESLNAGIAGSILIYELARQRRL